jgi:hypothetical protein
LIVGVVRPLLNRVELLETTVLNLAQASLTDSNGLTCPDPRLRILTPLGGQAYPAGSTIRLIGTAQYPDAQRYQIEARPTDGTQWGLVNRLRQDTRLGALAEWDTATLPPGNYELRLSAVDLNNIRLADSSPCAIAVTLLPAGQP